MSDIETSGLLILTGIIWIGCQFFLYWTTDRFMLLAPVFGAVFILMGLWGVIVWLFSPKENTQGGIQDDNII